MPGPGHHGLETEAASLPDPPSRPLPRAADWTVRTDTLGEAGGPSPPGPRAAGLWGRAGALLGRLDVAEDIVVASDMGMRQRPLPCRYCMADPMSSSMSLATWFSATIRPSLADDDAA